MTSGISCQCFQNLTDYRPDLHGQWDYGNAWSTDGCKAGDCLRHHTNKTETELALVMVTKAGVPSNKVNSLRFTNFLRTRG
jgi:hypothetical protein